MRPRGFDGRWLLSPLQLWPLWLGVVFCAASLTPSLVPRPLLLQGILGGLSLISGYGLAAWTVSFWRAFHLPVLRGAAAKVAHILLAAPALAILVYCCAHFVRWQNSIRLRVGMEEVTQGNLAISLLVAAAVFGAILLLARLIRAITHLIVRGMGAFLSPRAANLAGIVVAAILLFVATDRGIVRGLFGLADEAYAASAAFFAPDLPPPAEAFRAGSAGSLLDWGAMGSAGRMFITSGPDAADIAAFTGRSAVQPLRIYVGREEADTPEGRTKAALAEMDRVGAFNRAVLVLATPTGTGWLDPGSHDVVEFLHDGDVATVAVQYSYLTSAVTLLFETNTGLDQAVSLFNGIYDRWATLPENDRPRLYLHGISLGSWASMYSLDPFRMLGDPVDGAFWVGPPFPSDLWRRATAARTEGSSFVLPEVDDGRMVRFTDGRAPVSPEGWGRFRVLYLQHGSDAIVFYDPASAWRRPAWLGEPLAADVSPIMRWIPVVTMVQLALDMALSKLPPPGYGHNYTADEYVRGWIAISDPPGWDDEAAIRSLEERCGPTLDSGCME